jgi:hypothetical protein
MRLDMHKWLKVATVSTLLSVACHSSHSYEIHVQSPTPPFGAVHALPDCEVINGDLTLHLTATCVVDRKKRIVVTDYGDAHFVFDSIEHTEVLIPNIPNEDKFVSVQLPHDLMRRLQSKMRHLLIQLTGDCGSEHAAGSFECQISRGE